MPREGKRLTYGHTAARGFPASSPHATWLLFTGALGGRTLLLDSEHSGSVFIVRVWLLSSEALNLVSSLGLKVREGDVPENGLMAPG